MKKIMLLIVAILIIGLVGCTPKTDVSNNDNENMANENLVLSGENTENDNRETSGENISQNTELTEKELVEKYKLSDGYVLNLNELNNIYNVLNDSENNNLEIESDGVKFKVECVNLDNNDNLKITVNGKDLKLFFEQKPYEDAPELVSTITNDWVGIIDLDSNDLYKEIVVNRLLRTRRKQGCK